MFTGKITVIISLCIILSAATLAAQENPGETKKESLFSLEGSVAIIPWSQWSFPEWPDSYRQNLKYRMEASRTTIYEANFRFEPVNMVCGLNLGVDDSIMGKIDRIAGVLGYDHIYARLSQSTIRGKATWNGPATGMDPQFRYRHDFRSFDVFYNTSFETQDRDNIAFWYVGLGYTEFSVPIQVRTFIYTASDLGHDGNSSFDEDFRVSVWSFIFGFDTFSGMMRNPGGATTGFHFWGSTQDRFGFGKYRMSDETFESLKTVNPGTNLVGGTSGWAFYDENDTTLGIFYVPSFSGGRVAFGIGYNLLLSFVLPFSETGKKTNDMEYRTNFTMLRHGVIFRADAVW
jgi:hypothetical protein